MDKGELDFLGVPNEIWTPLLLGHPCESQQGQELAKCGLNWQSSSSLPDVQIIKVTTVTGSLVRESKLASSSATERPWKSSSFKRWSETCEEVPE